jgi:hypothetical protein
MMLYMVPLMVKTRRLHDYWSEKTKESTHKDHPFFVSAKFLSFGWFIWNPPSVFQHFVIHRFFTSEIGFFTGVKKGWLSALAFPTHVGQLFFSSPYFLAWTVGYISLKDLPSSIIR